MLQFGVGNSREDLLDFLNYPIDYWHQQFWGSWMEGLIEKLWILGIFRIGFLKPIFYISTKSRQH